MRIGIDARFLSHPQSGGFKTYISNLIPALASIDKKNEYILYLDRELPLADWLRNSSNFVIRVVKNQLPLVGMIWREQIQLPLVARKDKVDLFHAPSLTAPLNLHCPLVVTLHDMIWYLTHQYKKLNRSFGRDDLINLYYRNVVTASAKKAIVIITVSNFSKDEIIRYLNIPNNRIKITYLAVNTNQFFVLRDEIIEDRLRRFKLPCSFLLAIGSADPRKNIMNLVRAYGLLSDKMRSLYPLVIIWTHKRLEADVTKFINYMALQNNIIFLDNVSNDELVALYNKAKLFIFPSLYEGFGFPPLEAMACGTPVVSADNSSLPEVVGDAALLFNANDLEDIKKNIEIVLFDDNLYSVLVDKGKKRVKKFSWEKCAKETVLAYEMAV